MLPTFSRAQGSCLVAALASCWLLTVHVHAQTVNVIEYYNASQDHYFISSLLPDINALDSGHFPGWVRTGLSFGAYPQANPGSSPVCRFYIPPIDGDSHFYSASPTECAAVQSRFPAFVLESSNVMYIDLPDPITGGCPASDVPVYRVWDQRADTNHRYTTSLAIRAQMVAKGWVGEGYGPALVIMCAPPGPKIGRYPLAARGVYALFDRRGYPNGYYSGDVLHLFNDFDTELQNALDVNFPGAQASPTVSAETALQLDQMAAMGVNTITFELRTSDPTYIPGPFVPPLCNLSPSLGLQWPQPTAAELSNFVAFLDLAQTKAMRVWLRLPNTHMEEQPPTNSTTWLGAILNAVKNHPALDLVLFEGNAHLIDTTGNGILNACGVPAEPPLYLGPTAYGAQYVQWAINFARSLGMPTRKLSAEAIVGSYFVDTQQPPAGSTATDGHLWYTLQVLKTIFDNLGIPDDQRTYALSFYEHPKCFNPNGFNLPCTDADPHTWADATLQLVLATVGQDNGARIVAPEIGNVTPITDAWPSQYAMESIAFLLQKYGIEGGAYWTWSEMDAATEAQAGLIGEPVKRRGLAFAYNPVQAELLDAYGFHLASIANSSFESGAASADHWTASGAGTVARFRLADEPGQPVIATRGDYALRLITGAGATDTVSALSDPVAASPNTSYTTTANLRFQWTGDPLVGTADPSRPQVYVAFHYLRPDGGPSLIRATDTFRWYQENAPAGFGTFPVVYTTPPDTQSVVIEYGAARNGLPQAITLDLDNVR